MLGTFVIGAVQLAPRFARLLSRRRLWRSTPRSGSFTSITRHPSVGSQGTLEPAGRRPEWSRCRRSSGESSVRVRPLGHGNTRGRHPVLRPQRAVATAAPVGPGSCRAQVNRDVIRQDALYRPVVARTHEDVPSHNFGGAAHGQPHGDSLGRRTFATTMAPASPQIGRSRTGIAPVPHRLFSTTPGLTAPTF